MLTRAQHWTHLHLPKVILGGKQEDSNTIVFPVQAETMVSSPVEPTTSTATSSVIGVDIHIDGGPSIQHNRAIRDAGSGHRALRLYAAELSDNEEEDGDVEDDDIEEQPGAYAVAPSRPTRRRECSLTESPAPVGGPDEAKLSIFRSSLSGGMPSGDLNHDIHARISGGETSLGQAGRVFPEVLEGVVTEEKNEGRRDSNDSRRLRVIGGVALVVSCIAFGVGLGLAVGKDDTGNTSTTYSPPTVAPTSLVDLSYYVDIVQDLTVVDQAVFGDAESAQYRALEWLASVDTDYTLTEEKIRTLYALAVLYFGTNGRQWNSNHGFLDSNDPCEWNTNGTTDALENDGGVLCTDSAEVKGLFLSNNNLKNELPHEISGLRGLQELQLPDNRLSSTIPSSVFRLTSLQTLNLARNRFSGTISDDIAMVSGTLEWLDLNHNQFLDDGRFPWRALTSHESCPLKHLGLQCVSLEFEGPIDWDALTTNATALEYLDVSNCGFTVGQVPPNGLEELRRLHLGWLDKVEGPLENVFAERRKLEVLELSETWIDSTLPTSLGTLEALEELHLHRCDLPGTIPTELGRLQRLKILDLGDNSLDGSVPTEFGNLTSLELVNELARKRNKTPLQPRQDVVSAKTDCGCLGGCDGARCRIVVLNLEDTMHQQSATAELKQFLSTPPPNFKPGAGGSHNQASIAHAALQTLRDSGDGSFLFIRSVLELVNAASSTSNKLAPTDEELLFHCITGCRHVILTKWTTFSPTFRRAVRDYFLALGVNQPQRTIRLAYYNASASFWKRMWNESEAADPNDTPNLRAEERAVLETLRQQHSHLHPSSPFFEKKVELFQYLAGLMQPTQPQLMVAGSSFLSTLVGEFAGKSSSNYNMPFEFHKRAHAAFEKPHDGAQQSWLDQSLQMSMKALSEVVSLLNDSSAPNTMLDEDGMALTVVHLTIDVIAWEFGTDAWDIGFPNISGNKMLVKPPPTWRDVLLQPDFVKAVFHVHSRVCGALPTSSANSKMEQLCHGLRQLLLLLTSLSGSIFQGTDERRMFAGLLLEGIVNMISLSTTHLSTDPENSTLLVDTLSMVSRLIVNYKLTILVELPPLNNLLQGMATIGRCLLKDNLQELQAAEGDVEAMEHREWREEALALLVEGLVLLCGDPWILYSGREEARSAVQAALAATLGPLYVDFVVCRTNMSRLEEHYFTALEADLDEVREEIVAVDMEEEMAALANLGRLDLGASLATLSSLFQQLVPKLQSLWEGNAGVVSPEAAGLLEESRLVTMYIGHLLTDDNAGETPVIPDSVVIACQDSNSPVTKAIVDAVHSLHQFAHFQVSKIAMHPGDTRLSPLLAKSFLWFFHRWAPAYIAPVHYGASKTLSSILKAWSSTEAVQESVSFVVTLCLHYHCYWPHERQVQENAALALLSLARRCSQMRLAMVSTPSFRQLVTFHCLTSGIRHSASPAEFESTVRSKAGNSGALANISVDMLRGYQRLPYDIKSRILTALLVGCSEFDDAHSKSLLDDCLKALQDAFSSLVHALSTKQTTPDNMDAKEMTCLCVELYGGVARAGDMVASERVPKFLTPSLPHLSGLMTFYAEDLSICESLLRMFRDYAEQFIAVLDPESCFALFQASAELLKSYSTVHCASTRVITHSAEEEQSYNDILCAIELLIQLGTKDFIDIGDSGVDSAQVTSMIFFGLQQILPLMTRGLLQFPTLCAQFFSLVGFMMETYPDKVSTLPYDLFDSLLESLLFAMSHHDATVAKSALHGLAGMFKEHLQSQSLSVHLASSQATFLDKCSRRLLMEVVFQGIIWDRLEAAGMALLPLVAMDLQLFAGVVQSITQQIPPEHQPRLSNAFEHLLQQQVLEKATAGGYEGRQNRIHFKKSFEAFCHEIHSFLVMK